MSTAIVASPSHTGSLNIAAHDFELVLRNHYDDHSSEVLRFWFFTAKKHGWNLKKLYTIYIRHIDIEKYQINFT